MKGIRVLVSTARKVWYQTHRIPGAYRGLKFSKKPNDFVMDENQNRATNLPSGLWQPIINPIEALLQLQKRLYRGSGLDFDSPFSTTISKELGRNLSQPCLWMFTDSPCQIDQREPATST